MKRVIGILVFMMVVATLVSCVPTEPKDMIKYCKDQYQYILDEVDPNFPHSFIGYCVSSLQTGKTTAYASLCNYEPIWQMISEEEGILVSNRGECKEYFKNLP